MPRDDVWFYQLDGVMLGPVTLAWLKEQILSGRLAATVRVRREDEMALAPAAESPEFGLRPPSVQPPLIPSPPARSEGPAVSREAGATGAGGGGRVGTGTAKLGGHPRAGTGRNSTGHWSRRSEKHFLGFYLGIFLLISFFLFSGLRLAGYPPAGYAPNDSGAWPSPGNAPAGRNREEIPLPGGESLKLAPIPAGTFSMGSPGSESGRRDDEVQHEAVISRPFHMGVHEVTQAQWRAVMGTNPGRFEGDRLPVEQVSWEDATAFCRRVSELTGRRVRLPTEAEWEYACRAGTGTAFNTGETIGPHQANYNGDHVYGEGAKGAYRQETAEVGSFPGNAWGLHDMHGNVWEWCSDWYGGYPAGSASDPKGPESGAYRVLRGGGWHSFPWSCRSASRYMIDPGYRNHGFGFRVVMD
ncbi:MAG: SUMF1/EgtB/PvdO family nonheme iron enzyme [Planctomycetota bacterium]|jgi:hypothetical protein|nr:SUMF1/EgtB/PvdO family nonheme iron enzyme [Planctomycetota bacterium]